MTPADLMELGLKLFPVTPHKKPAMIGWQRYALAATIDTIRNDWRNGHRAFGIYLAPSRLVVLDADTKEADAWAEDALPDTPMRTITKRGQHRFYRLVDGERPPKDKRPIAGIALDRKAKGYVIAPGSVVGGFTYREATFWDTPLCELPDYPSSLFPQEPEPERCRIMLPDRGMDGDAAAIAKWFIDNSKDSIQGENGSAIMKHAASFFANGIGLSRDGAARCMFEWNLKRAQPEWSEREIMHAIDTSLREGAANGRPRGWAYADWAKS